MKVLKAHFDGKVLVPDEPVDLPVNCAVEVAVRPIADQATPLLDLFNTLQELPGNTEWPADGAAEHDHYLYGTIKKP